MRRALVVVALGTSALATVSAPLLAAPDSDWLAALIIALLAFTFALIGALVTMKQRGNVVGPLLVLVGTLLALWILAGSYSSHVHLQGNEDLPGGALALWLSSWVSIFGFGLMLIVFLRFPNGDLLSPRWRVVEWAALVGLGAGSVAAALRPGPTDYVPAVDNPLGIPALENAVAFAQGTGESLVSFVGLAAVGSLVLRFRRSRGMERQQLKWLVFAVALFPFVFSIAQVIGAIDTSERDIIQFLMNMAGAFLIPASMGLAILRYRLYEIDVLINRALVYGALTVAIAALYMGVVIGLRAVFVPFAGESDAAIALSTLFVAAIFRPVRTRIQSFVDRRFYRQRYDATQMVQRFASNLRDEVDLNVVRVEVLGVVKESLHPAHVSLWVPEEKPRRASVAS